MSEEEEFAFVANLLALSYQPGTAGRRHYCYLSIYIYIYIYIYKILVSHFSFFFLFFPWSLSPLFDLIDCDWVLVFSNIGVSLLFIHNGKIGCHINNLCKLMGQFSHD